MNQAGHTSSTECLAGSLSSSFTMIHALTSQDVREIIRCFPHFTSRFPENSIRKNYFLAACFHIDKNVDYEFINVQCPHGGIIGIDNSRLEILLGNYKLLRLHAILHDACGYMKTKYNVGPGYIYTLSCALNSCFLGHISGITFCTYLKFFEKQIFNNLKC